jgi:hypothetical protein
MAAAHQDRLALIDLLDRDGHARVSVPVTQWPVRIGRAIDCDVVLDDPHVAAHHAVLEADDDGGTVRLEVGTSHNGVRVGRQQFPAGSRVPVTGGTPLQIGTTRLRVRLAGDVLAPEEPLALERVLPWWGLVLLALALMAWLLGRQWLETDPGEPAIEYISVLWSVPTGLAIWVGLCALGAKLFRHHFEYLPHLGVALSWMLIVLAADFLLHAMAYTLGWSWASRISALVQGLLGAAWVYSHLALIVPARRKTMAALVLSLFGVGSIVGAALAYQREDRFFSELYMATLGPPSLRLAGTMPAAQFFEDAAALRARLEGRAKDKDEESMPPETSDE